MRRHPFSLSVLALSGSVLGACAADVPVARESEALREDLVEAVILADEDPVEARAVLDQVRLDLDASTLDPSSTLELEADLAEADLIVRESAHQEGQVYRQLDAPYTRVPEDAQAVDIANCYGIENYVHGFVKRVRVCVQPPVLRGELASRSTSSVFSPATQQLLLSRRPTRCRWTHVWTWARIVCTQSCFDRDVYACQASDPAALDTFERGTADPDEYTVGDCNPTYLTWCGEGSDDPAPPPA